MTQFPIGPFVRIAPDGAITFLLTQSEMGQGISTGLAQIFAEELDADWSTVQVEMTSPAEPYRMSLMGYTGQFVGGSLSTCLWTSDLRKAGAAARTALIAAAAARWSVPASQCRASLGIVYGPNHLEATYGDLAEAASQLPLPTDPPLKSEASFRLIGKPLHRLDSPAKIRGAAIYGTDTHFPGLLYATPRVIPNFGGRLAGYDSTTAQSMPGVVRIVPIENGVIVVATSQHIAFAAASTIELVVDPAGWEHLDNAWIEQQLLSSLDAADAPARNDGDVASGLAAAHTRFTAEYFVPYIAHATLEPVNCTALVSGNHCTVWLPTQGQDVVRNRVALALGIEESDVEVHTTFIGGGFGRKFFPDFAVQAALAARATGQPVKLIWTRQEDFTHDHYRPALMARFHAGLNAAGELTTIDAHIRGQGLLTQIFPIWTSNGLDEATVEGTRDLPYRIPHVRVGVRGLDLPIPLGFLRSVGRFGNAFFVESFIDEIAHHLHQDPVQYRRDMLAGDTRALGVIDEVTRLSRWEAPPAPGRFRGFAYHPYGGRGDNYVTPTALVCEVSLALTGAIRIHKVWCAVDCGLTINPNLVRAQIEGGIGFALSAAIHNEVTFSAGAVQQHDYNAYGALRIAGMPDIETSIMPSKHPPGGVGECSVPPFAPALANAIFAATGRRIRRLPFLRQGIEFAPSRE
jgi:isoquinoline 1-oxidoreductase subunit beta